MSYKAKDLTEGSLWKKILFFSVPLMLSNLLQVLFNLSDLAVVGQFSGPDALGAVGSTSILVALYTAFLIGMGSGVNVLTARYYGAKNNKDVSETVHTSALLCFLLGIAITALGIMVTRPVLELLHTKEELINGAELYLKIYLTGMPALAVYNFGNAVFSAVGDTKKPLYFLMISGVVNVILNLFFVLVFKMSVDGVALASVISLYLSAFLILFALCREQANYSLHRKMLKITKSKARQILAIGIPSGFQNSIFAIANLFIQSGVNSFSATMVSGNSAAANADPLVYNVMDAFYIATASFIGQNYGAGKKDRVRKSYFIGIAYSFGAGAVLGVLLLLFGDAFLHIFTNDEATAAAGMKRLLIMSWSYCISAVMDCSIAASRGLGKSVIPTVVVILGSCVFRVVWIYTVFAYFKTIPSLYLLYVFSWIITGIAEMWYFFYSYKKVFPSKSAL